MKSKMKQKNFISLLIILEKSADFIRIIFKIYKNGWEKAENVFSFLHGKKGKAN